MIKAVFDRDAQGAITAFSLNGHADAGDYGYDIVCAAVSAVSIGAVNGIEALAGFTPKIAADEDHGGRLQVQLPEGGDEDQQRTSQILLESLLLSLQGIEAEYGEHLTITTQQEA